MKQKKITYVKAPLPPEAITAIALIGFGLFLVALAVLAGAYLKWRPSLTIW